MVRHTLVDKSDAGTGRRSTVSSTRGPTCSAVRASAAANDSSSAWGRGGGVRMAHHTWAMRQPNPHAMHAT